MFSLFLFVSDVMGIHTAPYFGATMGMDFAELEGFDISGISSSSTTLVTNVRTVILCNPNSKLIVAWL